MQKQIPVITAIIILSMVSMSIIPVQTVAGEEINWYSYQEGLNKAKQQDKPVFIDFWSESCRPCLQMEEEVYTQQIVKDKTDEIIFVKVNTAEQRDLAIQYNLEVVPTLIFTDPQGDEIKREEGYHTASELVNLIDEVVTQYESGGYEDNGDTNTGDVGGSNTNEEEPFWENIIFIEVVLSIIAAVSIILVLRYNKTRKEEKG